MDSTINKILYAKTNLDKDIINLTTKSQNYKDQIKTTRSVYQKILNNEGRLQKKG